MAGQKFEMSQRDHNICVTLLPLPSLSRASTQPRAPASTALLTLRRDNKTFKKMMPEQSSSQQLIHLNVQSASRILISGFPSDVTAPQLHELFDQTVSPVNRVDVYCDSNGVSKGIALIEFNSIEAALKSHEQFHGKLIDKVSTITVEIVTVPAIPALLPEPPQPVLTTTIAPPSHKTVDQPAIPVAPRAQKRVKPPPPPPSKLSLKQRLGIQTPPPPRRYLFNNSVPSSGIKTKKQNKTKKFTPNGPAAHAKKPKNSRAAGYT